VTLFQVVTLLELGGAQAVVASLANALAEKGHEVVVIAGEGDGKLFGLLDGRVKTAQVETLRRKIAPVCEIKTLLALRRLYRRFKPDVVHLHSSKASLLGRLAFPPKKIVYTVHGFDSIRLAYRAFLPLERLLQYRCKAIVAVSNYDAGV